MQPLKKISLLAAVLAFSACSKDSTDDLIDNSVVPETVTYSQNIAAIINANCIVCHAATPVNGAPMSLTTYANVRQAVLERGLLDRISRDNGEPGLMPNGGPRLPQNSIDLINQWNAQGLEE